MTNEEFEKRWERQVEFILNQQAQHEAEMDETEGSSGRKLNRV